MTARRRVVQTAKALVANPLILACLSGIFYAKFIGFFPVFIDNTPIDYLDFASPVGGLGSKVGFDATNKWPGETDREWGTPIAMDEATCARVDEIWDQLGLSGED